MLERYEDGDDVEEMLWRLGIYIPNSRVSESAVAILTPVLFVLLSTSQGGWSGVYVSGGLR